MVIVDSARSYNTYAVRRICLFDASCQIMAEKANGVRWACEIGRKWCGSAISATAAACAVTLAKVFSAVCSVLLHIKQINALVMGVTVCVRFAYGICVAMMRVRIGFVCCFGQFVSVVHSI